MSGTSVTKSGTVQPYRSVGAPPAQRSRAGRAPQRRAGAAAASRDASGRSSGPRRSRQPHDSADDQILFQRFFKSVGPRTYAAQLKRARNGNHYLVFTEGKRDERTGEVRKARLFVYAEDFVEFFRLLKASAEFVKEHPVPDEVRDKQMAYWRKVAARAGKAMPTTSPAVPALPPPSAAPRPAAGNSAGHAPNRAAR